MLHMVLDYISRTNLFNFIIFALIIIYLCIKLDVSGKLKSASDNVAETIDLSEKTRIESEKVLKDVENELASIGAEIDGIIAQSEYNAKQVADKIVKDTEKSKDLIKNNTLKVVENHTELLKNDILKRASLASIEVAKQNILNELNKNPDLHYKLIDESVSAIDGMNEVNT